MVDVEEKLAQGWIKCNMIIEIVGKPKEHVEEAMKLILKKLNEEKNMHVLEGKVHKPKEAGIFFSSFVELELIVKNMAIFTTLCFDYMPSSVEIVQPENMKVRCTEVSDFVNDMLAKLHDVDMRFKNVNASNVILDKNLRGMFRNFILALLASEKQSLQQLAVKVGIPEQQLLPFLDEFKKEGLIKLNGTVYEHS
jgi:hypothetical protein